MLRKFKKVIVLFLSLVIFITSFELTGFEVQAANYNSFKMANPNGTSGVDFISYTYQGGCGGNFEPYKAIPWYTWAGVSHSWRGFLDAGGHKSGCYLLKKDKGGEINIYHDGDIKYLGYNVRQTKMGVEYEVDGYLYCHGDCRHFPSSWADRDDARESLRYGSEHVNRVGNVNSRCNVCGKEGSGNSINKICNGGTSNGKHLWYGDVRGLTKCWHCGYTLPALQLGSCTTTATHNAKWGFSTTFTGDDPSANTKFNKGLTGSGTASMIIKYGGSFKIDLNLYNYTKNYQTIVTQCYFTKTSPQGVTSIINNNDGTQPNCGGQGGTGYNYALPSDPNASTWSHNYSISFDNVTESGWVYNFIIKDKYGNTVKSPDIKVDTTIVFFDYSPNDGVANNELYYNKGHLIDNSGTVHSADGSANSSLNVAHTRTMVQSRALDPSKSYSTDGSKTVNLPQATLFWRYDLYPRTIGSANIAMNSTATDTNSGNNYKVLMPDYFRNKVFDFDDGIDTNKTDSSGNATSLNDASKYSNQTARAGVIYPKSDANGTRYKYSLYNTESLVKWTLAKRDLVAATGKTPVVGTQVSNTTSPNALGVVGKHWANAVYEMDVSQSTNRADLQLPRPERYLAIKLVDLDGSNIQVSDLVDGTLTDTSQAYNGNVKSTSFTVEDYNVGGQLAKGGTYLGAGLIPDNYNGVYLTYRFGFDGWYSTASGLQPIYHTHNNSCYRGITHTHDGTCYTAITHKHLIDHIHDMNCEANGCTMQSCYQYEYHKHTGIQSEYGGCYQGASALHEHYYIADNGDKVVCNDVNHKHDTASGCFKTPVVHQHVGSTALEGENKGGTGTCYTTPIYHQHTGDSLTGGGCYTVPVYHQHIGGTALANGGAGTCYETPVYHNHSGCSYTLTNTKTAYETDIDHDDFRYDCRRCGYTWYTSSEVSGDWADCPKCVTKVYNCGKSTSTIDKYKLSCTLIPADGVTAHGHIGGPDPDKGGAGTCWATPNYHSHSGNTTSGGACYQTVKNHTHVGGTSLANGGAGTCYETPVYHSHTEACKLYKDGTWYISKSGYKNNQGGWEYQVTCNTCNITYCQGFDGKNYASAGGIQNGQTHVNCTFIGYNCGKDTNTIDSYKLSCTLPAGTYYELSCPKTASTIDSYSFSCSLQEATLDGYDLGCGMTTSTQVSWDLSCTKTPGETIDYYALSCDRTGLADSYELSCGKTEETIVATNLICPLTENDVIDEVLNCTKTSDGQTLVCGMTEQTITGYKSVSSSSKTFTRYQASEGYVSNRENVDLYARWLSNYDMKLPQVEKPGYQFVGWYTIPQTQPDMSNNNVSNDGNGGIKYPEAKRTWTDGVTRDAWAGGGYGRDTTFRLNSVNLDDSTNTITLYAWFNRAPIYADVYEGLFFEGQSVTLKDLTRLISVFDWESDYYNEALAKIYNLPTIDRKNMYIDIVVDKDNTREEDEDETSIGGGLDEIDKDPNRVIVDTVFDSTRWTCKGWVDNKGNIVAQNTSGAVDGIYQYIGSEKGDYVETKNGIKYYEKGTEQNGVFTGFTYYTADAKQHIESLLNASRLDIYVKEVKYDITDYLDNKQETFNTRSVPLNQYENVKIDTSSDRMIFRTDDEGGFRDTSRFYGEFYVTYEVTDNGILAGSAIQAGSPITITYTRKCKLDYNDPPLLYMSNMTIDNRENLTYAQFEQELLANQVVIDAQDSQTNVPWWTKKQTQEALQATKKVTGLTNIKVLESVEKQIPGLEDYLNSTYKHPSSLWSLKGNTSNFNALPVIGVNTFTNNDIWEAIDSFDILIDAHDQFGKHVLYNVDEDFCGSEIWYTTTDGTLKAESGSHNHTDCNNGMEQPTKGLVVSDGVGNLPLSDIDQLRTPDEYRSVYIMLVNPNSDLLIDRVSLTENIRYINDEYLSTLGGSYYGTVGYGLEKLTEVLDTRTTKPSSKTQQSGSFYISDGYSTDGSREVNISVNDYSN